MFDYAGCQRLEGDFGRQLIGECNRPPRYRFALFPPRFLTGHARQRLHRQLVALARSVKGDRAPHDPAGTACFRQRDHSPPVVGTHARAQRPGHQRRIGHAQSGVCDDPGGHLAHDERARRAIERASGTRVRGLVGIEGCHQDLAAGLAQDIGEQGLAPLQPARAAHAFRHQLEHERPHFALQFQRGVTRHAGQDQTQREMRQDRLQRRLQIHVAPPCREQRLGAADQRNPGDQRQSAGSQIQADASEVRPRRCGPGGELGER